MFIISDVRLNAAYLGIVMVVPQTENRPNVAK